MQTTITRPQFIKWITDILKANHDVRKQVVTAIVTDVTIRHSMMASYQEEWKFDAATDLGGSIIENDVPGLIDELLIHWQKEFETEVTEAKKSLTQVG